MSGNKSGAARRFEELHIYQRARELAKEIYKITKSEGFARDFGLIDQIRRASVSVLSNIAEGFDRGGKQEFIQFLYIAKGSCGEVRAQLHIAEDQNYIGADESRRLCESCKLVSGMISNFIGYIQTSDYQGEKIDRPKRLYQTKDKKRLDKIFSQHGVTLPNCDEPEV